MVQLVKTSRMQWLWHLIATPYRQTKDSKTKNAIKAKLRRLCEKKANGRLNVPEWLHNQWKNGDHLSMALKFKDANFDKESFLCYLSSNVQPSITWWSQCPIDPCSKNVVNLTGHFHQAVREDDDRDRAPEEQHHRGMVLQIRYENRTEVAHESGPNMILIGGLANRPYQPKQVISSFILTAYPSFPGRRSTAQSRCACRMKNTWWGRTPQCLH